MKRYLLFLIAVIAPMSMFSQIEVQIGPQKSIKSETIDTGVVRIMYETKSVKDPEKPDKLTKDYQILEIGEKGISRFYSNNRRLQDSILAELIKRNPTQIDMGKLKDNGISSSGNRLEVFKNYPQGKITVTDQISSTDYLYEDNLNEIPWQMFPDTMTILSYLCQKAEGDFRGRHYTAWFAPEFPINEGPWKFSGLPGLILAVEDSALHFRFQAIGIERVASPIHFAKKNYIKTSRKEVEKVQKRFAEDPIALLSNSHPGANIKIVVKDADGVEKTGSEIGKMKIPYYPIELE